jgi:hypothetical protein
MDFGRQVELHKWIGGRRHVRPAMGLMFHMRPFMITE